MERQAQEALDQLRADFPHWWFGQSEDAIGWKATRRQTPGWEGGISVVQAAGPEDLRTWLALVACLEPVERP